MAETVSEGHKTRGEAMMAAVAAIQADLLPGDTATLVACRGRPECAYDGEGPMPEDCPRCTRLVVGEELARA